MRIYLTIISLIFFVQTMTAQTEKGNWMVGGTAQIKAGIFKFDNLDGANYFFFGLDPRGAYFVKNNLALGAGLTLRVTAGDEIIQETTSIGFAPYGRYFFPSDQKIRFFGEGSLGFLRNSGSGNSSTSFISGLGFGAGIFVSNNVLVEAIYRFDYQHQENLNQFETGVALGFQIFLTRDK